MRSERPRLWRRRRGRGGRRRPPRLHHLLLRRRQRRLRLRLRLHLWGLRRLELLFSAAARALLGACFDLLPPPRLRRRPLRLARRHQPPIGRACLGVGLGLGLGARARLSHYP